MHPSDVGMNARRELSAVEWNTGAHKFGHSDFTQVPDTVNGVEVKWQYT